MPRQNRKEKDEVLRPRVFESVKIQLLRVTTSNNHCPFDALSQPRVIPSDDDDGCYSLLTSESSSDKPSLSREIPPDKDIIGNQFPTSLKTNNLHKINVLENNLDALQNHFINIVTNPFTVKEKSCNGLIKYNSKDE